MLASLLRETPKAELPMLVYLTQGKLRPDYEGVELGIAEKFALRALTTASGNPVEAVRRAYVEAGDIGTAAETLLEEGRQDHLFSEPLTLQEGLRHPVRHLPESRGGLNRVEAQGAREPAERRVTRRRRSTSCGRRWAS